jgi:hypothetical protein
MSRERIVGVGRDADDATAVRPDYAPIVAFAGAFSGCLTTLNLTAFGVAPGIASALATALLCGQLLVTRRTNLFPCAFFPALYGGTFGGMTSVFGLGDSASARSATLTCTLVIVLSIVCGLAFFVAAKLDARSTGPIASGYGGRSGAIATLASFLFIVLGGLMGADASVFHGVGADVFTVEPQTASLAFFACIGGTFATLFVLRQRRVAAAEMANRIFIASAVALFGLMALHLGLPGDARTLDAFYAGCFLGMSTPERLNGWFQPVLGALVLTSTLVLVHAVLPGVGGSLGFAAFVTVAILVALNQVAAWTTRETQTRHSRVATDAASTSTERNPAQTLRSAANRNHIRPSERLEPGRPNPRSEPRTSSSLNTLARLGAAIANGGITTFLVVASLLHGNADLLDRRAEDVPDDMGMTVTERLAPRPARTAAHLVVADARTHQVDELTPLGVSLANADDADAVVLSGLPSNWSLTNGRRSAAGGWHLFADELANAAIRPLPRFVGGADITLELRRAGLTIDRQALHIEWIGGPPPATSEAASLPIVGSPRGGSRRDGTAADQEALLREFSQWLSKRSGRQD